MLASKVSVPTPGVCGTKDRERRSRGIIACVGRVGIVPSHTGIVRQCQCHRSAIPDAWSGCFPGVGTPGYPMTRLGH